MFDSLGSVSLFLSAICLLLGYLIFSRKGKNNPPCYSGWIPWLGCAVEFGKSPIQFINHAKQRFGPVFTLQMTGKRLTFITEVEDFDKFFQSSSVDFQKAVQQPVQKTGNVPPAAFQENHSKIHDTVKGKLASTQLQPICINLSKKFHQYLQEWGEKGQGDLNQLVRSAMYKAVADNLFGEHVLPTKSQKEYEKFEKHFVRFDEDFEYGSQLPGFFLKEWSNSKWWLLSLFKDIEKDLKQKPNNGNPETLLETLLHQIKPPYGSNFGVLMLWASLANAIPITFWTLAFILSNSDILKQCKEETEKYMELKEGVIEQENLLKMPIIKRCILEAIRLRAPGVITRAVTKEFKIRNYTVPVGDLLMLSPYWAHRNPKLFPEPEKFNPGRWEGVDLEKNPVLEGFIAFGGGRYQCPGRWFALMEIHAFVAMILKTYEIELLSKVPENSQLHLVGTQQPVGPCKIKYNRILK